MSSDPTQPTPEWWQQQPKSRGDQGNQGNQGNQGYAGNQGYSGNQGYPGTPDYPGNQGAQGPQGTQRFEANQGYPAAQAYQGPPARYRRRRRRWPLVTLIVIVLILVVADRAANAFTEDQMASQVQSSLELSGKPHVSIQGFPFLTQLAARDFKTVDITASNETAGTGGQLEIASLNATLHGMHIHGLNSATIDQFNATALVTFTALAKAGGIPQGITLSADGPNRVKANISIGPLSDTAVAQVTQSGAGQINVKIIDAGGIPTSVLGSLANFSVSIPKLPAGVSIQSVSVTQQGVLITANGHNTTLSQ
jgi:LmeA-like phospholipid-binding/Collagen triple helix repeat (20 copies)